MKSYYSSDKLKKAFYDPHCRTWTMLQLDAQGNQIGDAVYHASRSIAFAWLAAEVNQFKSCKQRLHA